MNKVILIGRLGQAPDSRVTANGANVASLNIATSERKKESDKWVDSTEWHRVVAFGKTAELAVSHLDKGSQVAIEGSLRTNKWQDKDGKDRYTTEVVCQRLEFIGAKQQGGKPAREPGSDDGYTKRAEAFDDDDQIPF